MKKTQLQVGMEPQLLEAVESLAEAEGRSKSQMAARLIEQALGREAGSGAGGLVGESEAERHRGEERALAKPVTFEQERRASSSSSHAAGEHERVTE